jgi:hypothetical protein
MTYRNRKLLDLAHEAPCFADFPHQCGGWEGCDPAHSDSSIFGRGIGHKTPDWAYASMCHTAHMIHSRMEREEKFYAWLRAFKATYDYLWENKLIMVAK